MVQTSCFVLTFERTTFPFLYSAMNKALRIYLKVIQVLSILKINLFDFITTILQSRFKKFCYTKIS